MSYRTSFTGQIQVDPPFTAAQVEALRQFSRQEQKDGPSYYCDWESTPDGTAIQWVRSDNTVAAAEWLRYVVDNFVAPSGRVANGAVDAEGEEPNDIWRILVRDNVVKTQEAIVTWPDDGDNELGEEDLQVEWPHE